MKRLQLGILQEVKKHMQLGLSDRKIALALRCSRNTVAGIRKGSITETTILAAMTRKNVKRPRTHKKND
jgi:hypothetical protein